MNAGPDVERLISDWLIEEAPAHAPDRVLDHAARTIDRTKQRRFGAAWREPMNISMSRLVAAAVFIVVAVVGAGWVGRSTAAVGQSPTTAAPTSVPAASQTPAPTSSAIPAAVSLADYRLARNAICVEGERGKQLLKGRYALVLDPAATAAQLSDGVAALESFVTLADGVSDQLAALAVPPDLMAAHLANVTQYRDMTALLRYEIGLFRAGKVDQARAMDPALDAIGAGMTAFERGNSLAACP
jgi:hypothetical protein